MNFGSATFISCILVYVAVHDLLFVPGLDRYGHHIGSRLTLNNLKEALRMKQINLQLEYLNLINFLVFRNNIANNKSIDVQKIKRSIEKDQRSEFSFVLHGNQSDYASGRG